MTDTKKCEFCDKRGLPLLLVRNGVAPISEGAPRAAELPIALPDSAAHYTTRLLRSGYLYVYDEARKRWESFFVTPDGYYYKLIETPGMTPVVPSKPFNCPDVGHRAVASCITISDPKRAGKVWIGFSDVRWTNAIRAAHDDPAYRKRNMAVVDVMALLAGQMGTNGRPVKQVSAVVAEYAMDPKRGNTALGWSPFKFNARYGQSDDLIRECDALRPGKAVIVTIPDPAGIVQELAALMSRNAALFAENPEQRRKLAASAIIEKLEEAIRKQAVTDEIKAREDFSNEQARLDPLGHALFESTRKRTESVKIVTPEIGTQAENSAWSKYESKFDDKARVAWKKAFYEQLRIYDKKYIGPLAKSHVLWLKGAELRDYFQCNFDRGDVQSGLVYTEVFKRCIAGTQDKIECEKLYHEWLSGSFSDVSNLLLRAFCHDQDNIAAEVAKTPSVSFDLRQIPWDNIIAVYTKTTENFVQQSTDALGRCIVEITGPLTRALTKFLDGTPKFRTAVMLAGIVGKHPIVICDIVATPKQFQTYLIKQMLKIHGTPMNKKIMQKAVSDELARQQIRGQHLAVPHPVKRQFYVPLNELHIRNVPTTSATRREQAAWMAKSITTLDHIEALDLARWRSLINVQVTAGIIGGILQAICLTKLMSDQKSALANEKFDATARFYAGATAVGAMTSEIIFNAITTRASQSLRFGQGLLVSTGGALAKTAGFMGVGAGLAVALLDIRKVVESVKEDQPGLALLYGTSAFAGGGLTLAILFSAKLGALIGAAFIPFIGILVALIIGIGIWIEYLKDNPVQDWLERCPWGILKGQRYLNMETEQAELKKALG